MTENPLPDELTARRTIAERARELRMLRSVERALSRYRRDCESARVIRCVADATNSADENRKGVDRG